MMKQSYIWILIIIFISLMSWYFGSGFQISKLEQQIRVIKLEKELQKLQQKEEQK